MYCNFNFKFQEDGKSETKRVKESDHVCYQAQKNVIERTPSFIASFMAMQKFTSSSGKDLRANSTVSGESGLSTGKMSLKENNTDFVGRDNEIIGIFEFITETNRADDTGVGKLTRPSGVE